MRKEFVSLETKKSWTIVEFLKEKKTIGCKWVYKIKHKVDGSVERYKAILVVKGDT